VTADQVAAASGRRRAAESGYPNVLFRSGVVGKRRVGRREVFRLTEEYRAKG
jgi:hypothetical protein